MKRDIYVIYSKFQNKANGDFVSTRIIEGYATEESAKNVVDKMNAYIEKKTSGKPAALDESLVYYYTKIILYEE